MIGKDTSPQDSKNTTGTTLILQGTADNTATRRLREDQQDGPAGANGAIGQRAAAGTVVVAAYNSRDVVQAAADFVIPESGGEATFAQAVEWARIGYASDIVGTVLMMAGTYNLNGYEFGAGDGGENRYCIRGENRDGVRVNGSGAFICDTIEDLTFTGIGTWAIRATTVKWVTIPGHSSQETIVADSLFSVLLNGGSSTYAIEAQDIANCDLRCPVKNVVQLTNSTTFDVTVQVNADPTIVGNRINGNLVATYSIPGYDSGVVKGLISSNSISGYISIGGSGVDYNATTIIGNSVGGNITDSTRAGSTIIGNICGDIDGGATVSGNTAANIKNSQVVDGNTATSIDQCRTVIGNQVGLDITNASLVTGNHCRAISSTETAVGNMYTLSVSATNTASNYFG